MISMRSPPKIPRRTATLNGLPGSHDRAVHAVGDAVRELDLDVDEPGLREPVAVLLPDSAPAMQPT